MNHLYYADDEFDDVIVELLPSCLHCWILWCQVILATKTQNQ
ncbi:hypothetical protein UXO42_05720 [Enterobacter quasihormaechei]